MSGKNHAPTAGAIYNAAIEATHRAGEPPITAALPHAGTCEACSVPIAEGDPVQVYEDAVVHATCDKDSAVLRPAEDLGLTQWEADIMGELDAPRDERAEFPSGVAAIVGAAPELPECDCGEVYLDDDGHLPRCAAKPQPASDIATGRKAYAVALQMSDAVLVPNPLETEVANLRGAVDMLKEAAAGHVAEIERLTKERDARASEVVALIEKCNEWQMTARARLETIAKVERTRKRWQARARKAEKRVEVLEKMAEDLTAERNALEQERDGLTLRLGERVRGQVRRKAARAKGGR